MNRRVGQPAGSKNTIEKKTSNRRVNTPHKRVARAPAAEASGGARVSEASQASLFQAWFAHHRFSCRDSLQRLLRTPWQSIMTWLVVAIALVLPAVLYLGLSNAQQLGASWQNKAQMSVYIQYQAKPLAIEQLQQRLLLLEEIDSLTLVTPEEAKQDFQEYSGLGNVLESLDNNPLPAVLTVIPSSKLNSPEQLSALQKKLQLEALVDFVQVDITWLRRLYEIMNLAQHIVLALAALLSLGVLLIIGNTIRLAIENRRNEIIVIKMVGGTDGFVRRPFLYTGLWYGVGGGLFASLFLLVAGIWLSEPVQTLIALYKSDYSLTWLSFNYIIFIIVGAGILGWLGAWLAVSRHLRHIEPE